MKNVARNITNAHKYLVDCVGQTKKNHSIQENIELLQSHDVVDYSVKVDDCKIVDPDFNSS